MLHGTVVEERLISFSDVETLTSPPAVGRQPNLFHYNICIEQLPLISCIIIAPWNNKYHVIT